MWMTTVEENGETFDVAFRGGEIPNDGAPLVDNPRHPTVVEDTQRTLGRLKELSPPDLFLHNHARETSSGLNPDLPVNFAAGVNINITLSITTPVHVRLPPLPASRETPKVGHAYQFFTINRAFLS